MDDLIWVGNTLFPRSLVYWAVAIIVLVIVGTFTVLTSE